MVVFGYPYIDRTYGQNLETAFLNDNYRDYGVKLVHCQDIAHVRWKLENAILLLEAHLDVATTLAEHANSMCIVDDECLTGSPHDRFMSELLQYRCKIECHIRNARKHLRFAGVVNELVSTRPPSLPRCITKTYTDSPTDAEDTGLSKR